MLALTAVVSTSTADASPILDIRFGKPVGAQGCLSDSTSSGTGPISLAQSCVFAQVGAPVSTAEASGRANFGELGVDLLLTIFPQGAFSPSNTGSAQARSEADYIFTGPGPTVAFSINLDVHGHLETACASRCQMLSRIIAPGFDRQFVVQDGTNSMTIDETFTGNLVVMPTGIPVRIDLELELTGGLLFASSVSGLFKNTVNFHEGGPVFNLPAGFTVNGPCVIDNVFVCGSSPGPIPLPEPTSLALLLSGGAGVLAAVRRRPARS
jgi:hypothetical protein